MRRVLLYVTLCLVALGGSVTSSVARAEAETVMVTFLPKAGAEPELEKVIAQHWKTARELDLVPVAPHLTLRGKDEDGRAYFVEVFSWRDASIPDNAPPAIRQIWDRMNALVEKRGAKPGLSFNEVSVIP